MTEEKTPTRRRWWIAAAVGVVVLAGAALAGVLIARDSDSQAEAACEAPRHAPPAETGLMPARLAFDRVATVTGVSKDGPHVTVHAVSTKPLDELTVAIQDAVTAAGYDPAGMDNEEDEAEVFFQQGSLAAGQARVEESGCEGRWDVELVLLDQGADS
jgi:hypothetical protein